MFQKPTAASSGDLLTAYLKRFYLRTDTKSFNQHIINHSEENAVNGLQGEIVFLRKQNIELMKMLRRENKNPCISATAI